MPAKAGIFLVKMSQRGHDEGPDQQNPFINKSEASRRGKNFKKSQFQSPFEFQHAPFAIDQDQGAADHAAHFRAEQCLFGFVSQPNDAPGHGTTAG
jgi:hypothetical protein